jgi:hypothetical protein
MHAAWVAHFRTFANQYIYQYRWLCFLLPVSTLVCRWEDDTLLHVIWHERLRTNTHTELARFLDCSSCIRYRWEDDAQMPNECYEYLPWLGLGRLRTDACEQKAVFLICSSYIRVRMRELYTNVCYLKGVVTTENQFSVFAKERTVVVITLDLFYLRAAISSLKWLRADIT